jgi:hypothetical protein
LGKGGGRGAGRGARGGLCVGARLSECRTFAGIRAREDVRRDALHPISRVPTPMRRALPNTRPHLSPTHSVPPPPPSSPSIYFPPIAPDARHPALCFLCSVCVLVDLAGSSIALRAIRAGLDILSLSTHSLPIAFFPLPVVHLYVCFFLIFSIGRMVYCMHRMLRCAARITMYLETDPVTVT